jgi:hypothetical protein
MTHIYIRNAPWANDLYQVFPIHPRTTLSVLCQRLGTSPDMLGTRQILVMSIPTTTVSRSPKKVGQPEQ